jgi:hypothetical protein
MNLSNAILRGVTGAFILNAGLGKRNLPPEVSGGMKQAASAGVPAFKNMDDKTFGTFLSSSEIGIGAALLAPVVPTKVAGAALAAFSGGLMSMYFRTPGMTESDGIRPTQEGTPLAKDVFMLAIAGALLTNK